MSFYRVPAKQKTAAVLLAGGQGSRLYELTSHTCKPAVGFAGGRKIVDWTMHNLAGCALEKVLVASQYKPQELSAHLARYWRDAFTVGALVIRDGKTVTGRHDGYVGTADAVTQNLDELLATGAQTLLVVAADHIYTMDYEAMIAEHRAAGRSVTVAVDRVPRLQARSFGVMAADAQGKVTEFIEKPADPKPMLTDPNRALVSMGIYVFDMKWLADRLRDDATKAGSGHDFGHDILPAAVARGEVGIFDPAVQTEGFFWRDVGTLDSFRQCCIDIAQKHVTCDIPRYPDGQLADMGTRILEGGSVALPGARVSRHSRLRNTIVAPGVDIPAEFESGFDLGSDARFFRVTPEGTVLITPKMLGAHTRAKTAYRRQSLPDAAYAFGMTLNAKYA